MPAPSSQGPPPNNQVYHHYPNKEVFHLKTELCRKDSKLIKLSDFHKLIVGLVYTAIPLQFPWLKELGNQRSNQLLQLTSFKWIRVHFWIRLIKGSVKKISTQFRDQMSLKFVKTRLRHTTQIGVLMLIIYHSNLLMFNTKHLKFNNQRNFKVFQSHHPLKVSLQSLLINHED